VVGSSQFKKTYKGTQIIDPFLCFGFSVRYYKGDTIQLNYSVVCGGNRTINVYFMSSNNYSKFFKNKYYKWNISYEYIKYFHHIESFTTEINITYDDQYSVVSDNFFSDTRKTVKFTIGVFGDPGNKSRPRNYDYLYQFIFVALIIAIFLIIVGLKETIRKDAMNKPKTNSNKLRRIEKVLQYTNKTKPPIVKNIGTEEIPLKSSIILKEPVNKSNNIENKQSKPFCKEKVDDIYNLLEEHEVKLNKISIMLENSLKEVFKKKKFNYRCKHCEKEFLFEEGQIFCESCGEKLS
jgi:hypothetical protein